MKKKVRSGLNFISVSITPGLCWGDEMTMMYKSIPTKYNGVNFRSRLEAKWAAFFDLIGWKWEYEPVDFNGWIPDFLLIGANRPDGNVGIEKPLPVFVEIKPVLEIPKSVCCEVENSGCENDVLILGLKSLVENDDMKAVLGWLGEYEESYKRFSDSSFAWGEAILGRFRPSGGLYGSELGIVGFCHSEQSYRDRITGVYEGGSWGDDTGVINLMESLWKEAGNKVQWKKV